MMGDEKLTAKFRAKSMWPDGGPSAPNTQSTIFK